MDFSAVGRRIGAASGVVLGLALGLTAFGGAAQSGPSQGAAPVNIADPNNPNLRAEVTADSALQVTGDVTISGTSAVTVTNTPLPVQVGNFPTTQNVNVTGGALAPVSQILALSFSPECCGTEETQTFATINTTSITISTAGPGGPSEMRVHYLSPLTGNQLHPLFADDDGEERNRAYVFFVPDSHERHPRALPQRIL
jgi:hypothetical protein